MRLSSFSALIVTLLLLCSCADTFRSVPTVTVSISPLRYFVQNIAGPHFEVNTLVPAGASPETYELTPRQVVDVSDSRLYFCVGTLGFERERLERLTANAPRLTTVNLSDSISLIEDRAHTPHADAHDHDGIDLHIWTSVTNGRRIARNVCAALSRADSLHTAFYEQRRDSLLRHIDSLEVDIRAQLDTLRQRTFVIYHPALAYFARDFGLRQLSVETDGKEPSAAQLRQLIARAREAGVGVVFVQEEHAGRAARRLAEAIGARVVSIAPLSPEWDRQLLHIARALAASSSSAHDSRPSDHPSH